MKPGEWFDAQYFGHVPTNDHKSNYSRVGGYAPHLMQPELYAKVVAEKVDNGAKVLDVGCACGYGVEAMRAIGMDAWGCDVSEYILGKASASVGPYLFLADMTKLLSSKAVALKPFDMIVSRDVLEHVDEDRIGQVLLDMAVLTKRQFHVVNTGEFEYQAASGDLSHELVRPLVWWQDLAKSLGIDSQFQPS
jgi:2-polyprenyl-3-methyl-5-hydroxy-6-metoxy-1,4-benzoquinol methylase